MWELQRALDDDEREVLLVTRYGEDGGVKQTAVPFADAMRVLARVQLLFDAGKWICETEAPPPRQWFDAADESEPCGMADEGDEGDDVDVLEVASPPTKFVISGSIEDIARALAIPLELLHEAASNPPERAAEMQLAQYRAALERMRQLTAEPEPRTVLARSQR